MSSALVDFDVVSATTLLHAGVYPFAGKEVARAFALNSTDLDDCNDKVDDLSYTEKESLRDWTAKFNFKYPIVGKLLKSA